MLTLTAVMLGCRDQSPSGGALPLDDELKRGFIAFVGAGPKDPVWPVLQASARRHVTFAKGPRVQIFNPATDSPKAQLDLLQGLDDPDLRGLCIQVADTEVVAPVLHRLRNRGVPIVSMLEPAPERTRSAHVGLDETAVGHELARCTAKALGPTESTIMILHAGYDHPRFGARYIAFEEKIRLESRVKVLGAFDCRADPDEARRIIRDRSARYPRLTAWVAIADWPLQGDYPADQLFRPAARYFTVGGFTRHFPLVRKGIIPCVVGADYGPIGSRALQLCESAIRDPAQAGHLDYVPLIPLTLLTLEEYEKQWNEWVTDSIAAREPSAPSGP